MSKKFTIEYAKQYFEDEGCKLLETEYVNCMTEMRYRCSCGSISYISFSSFKSGCRCRKCGIKRRAEKQSITIESAKKYFEERGCELLETEYINSNTKMKYICPCGNLGRISFNCFKSHKHICHNRCVNIYEDMKKKPFRSFYSYKHAAIYFQRDTKR